MYPYADNTLALLSRGYAWAPALRRRHGSVPAVPTRLMGRPALLLHGPEAVEFFYDERHVLRHGALPGPVLDTLLGRAAVHTLDSQAHRIRKELFTGSPPSPPTPCTAPPPSAINCVRTTAPMRGPSPTR